MSLSIITTVLNNEKFIHDCVNSVKIKNLKDKYEHIIVDGGSKDNTLKILKKLKKNNKNLKIFIKKNLGIYEGINYAIKKSKYNYIGLLHSDDFYKNDKVLKNILMQFKLNNKLLSIHSNVEFVKRNNKKKIVRFFKSEQLKSEGLYQMQTSTTHNHYLLKKIFDKFGLYNINLKIASDFEFMLRIYGINKIYSKYINKTFIVMRAGGTSTRSIFNIYISNYEVYKSFKINNMKVNIFFILKKIFTKILQKNF